MAFGNNWKSAEGGGIVTGSYSRAWRINEYCEPSGHAADRIGETWKKRNGTKVQIRGRPGTKIPKTSLQKKHQRGNEERVVLGFWLDRHGKTEGSSRKEGAQSSQRLGSRAHAGRSYTGAMIDNLSTKSKFTLALVQRRDQNIPANVRRIGNRSGVAEKMAKNKGKIPRVTLNRETLLPPPKKKLLFPL